MFSRLKKSGQRVGTYVGGITVAIGAAATIKVVAAHFDAHDLGQVVAVVANAYRAAIYPVIDVLTFFLPLRLSDPAKDALTFYLLGSSAASHGADGIRAIPRAFRDEPADRWRILLTALLKIAFWPVWLAWALAFYIQTRGNRALTFDFAGQFHGVAIQGSAKAAVREFAREPCYVLLAAATVIFLSIGVASAS